MLPDNMSSIGASTLKKETRLNILLLAAGEGRRFQQSCRDAKQAVQIKQLANVNGMPLINHSIEQLSPLISQHNSCDSIYVALGGNCDKIQPVIANDTKVLHIENYALGMGHSIAESIKHITDESSHILIALVDQALVNNEHYHQLVEQSLAEPEKIIATLCADKTMAPAIFPKKYFTELMELQGDKGAGALLKRATKHVIALSCSAAKFDIDTLADLEHVSHLLKYNNP